MRPGYIREGFQEVTPYFIVENAERLIDFVAACFGAEIQVLERHEHKGVVRHAELRIGSSVIEVSEANAIYPPVRQTIHLYVPDTDACYRKALQLGAESINEPRDMPYGERGAGVRDPHGNQWFLATVNVWES